MALAASELKIKKRGYYIAAAWLIILSFICGLAGVIMSFMNL